MYTVLTSGEEVSGGHVKALNIKCQRLKELFAEVGQVEFRLL